jgi:hypothetical protein
VFCNEVKGKSALALSRDLSLSYKSAFVLLHKLREAMAEEMKGRVVGGDGKVAEVDGGYFGGTVSQPIKRNIAATAAMLATRMESVKSSSSSANEVEILSPPYSARRAKPLLSSAPALLRVLLYMPMKPLHGIACMNDLK